MVIQHDYCSLGHDESTMSSIFFSPLLWVTTESDSVPHCWRLQVIANTATWTWSWQDVETKSVSSEQDNPKTSSEIQEFHMAKCESISFHTVRWKNCNVCLLLGLHFQQCSCSTMRLAKTRVRPSAHSAQRQVYIGIDVQSSIEYPEARIEETNSWDITKRTRWWIAVHFCLSNPFISLMNFQISLLAVAFLSSAGIHVASGRPGRLPRWELCLYLPLRGWACHPRGRTRLGRFIQFSELKLFDEVATRRAVTGYVWPTSNHLQDGREEWVENRNTCPVRIALVNVSRNLGLRRVWPSVFPCSLWISTASFENRPDDQPLKKKLHIPYFSSRRCTEPLMKPVDFHHGLTMLNYQSDDMYLMIVGFYIPSFGRFITTTPDQPAE